MTSRQWPSGKSSGSLMAVKLSLNRRKAATSSLNLSSTCGYKRSIRIRSARSRGMPVNRSENGQQFSHRTMPMWRCEIPHFGRVREFFPVPLHPLPQGQRFGLFGKPVFVHCRNHLVVRRDKHQDVQTLRVTACKELLLRLRVRAASFPAGDWLACGAGRVA